MGKRSLGWDWFTAYEIEKLKEISKKDFEEVKEIFREYDLMFPSMLACKIIVFVCIGLIAALQYFSIYEIYWYIIIWTILTLSYWKIQGKLAEEKWYLQWYEHWIGDWVNKTLGITSEDEKKIAEIVSQM